MTRTHLFSIASVSCLAALVLIPAAALGATTLYASPSGSGTVCTEKSPCLLQKAVQNSVNGDSVVLAPGAYPLPNPGGLEIEKQIDIGGAVGAAASTVLVTDTWSVHVYVPKATLHDVRIEGTGGLSQDAGVVERVFTSYTGTASAGCEVRAGAVMRDDVCWTHDGGAASSSAILAEANGIKGTVTLRNVTAIGADKQAVGIYAVGSGVGAQLTVDAVNVIARGREHPDVEALLNGGLSTHVSLSHSDYATTEGSPPTQTVTDPASAGNQVAAPLFVNAATGDFHELSSSPTVDAGLLDPEIGTLDLDSRARVDGPPCGGASVPDIGAYEVVAPASCVGPDNRFHFGKVRLNRKKGTATLPVVVPGPGSLLLKGHGLKSVSKSVGAGGNVTLSVKAVGKTRKQLVEAGERKVRPKVTFTPTGGSSNSLSRALVLHRKVG